MKAMGTEIQKEGGFQSRCNTMALVAFLYGSLGLVSLACWLLEANICCGYRMATDVPNWGDKNNSHTSRYHS